MRTKCMDITTSRCVPLRKISTLSGGNNLEKLAAGLKIDFQGIRSHPIHWLSYIGNDQLLLRDPEEDADSDDNIEAKKILYIQARTGRSRSTR